MNIRGFLSSLLALGAASSQSLQKEENSDLPINNLDLQKTTKDATANLRGLDNLQSDKRQSRNLQEVLQSHSPTLAPTRNPTRTPTKNPTKSPSVQPSAQPTGQPTYQPTSNPTANATASIDCENLANANFIPDILLNTTDGIKDTHDYLNLEKVSSSLAGFLDNTCDVSFDLSTDLNSCAQVIGLKHINETDYASNSMINEKSTVADYMSYIISNPDLFKDEQLCFKVLKGDPIIDSSIRMCNESSSEEALATLGFNCAGDNDAGKNNDNNFLNDFFFYFAMAEGAASLLGVVYFGNAKNVNHGLTFCQDNMEFFNNVFDSKLSTAGFVIGAGTVITTGIRQFGENNLLHNMDGLDGLAFAVPNAALLTALCYKWYNSKESASAGNETFGSNSVHPDRFDAIKDVDIKPSSTIELNQITGSIKDGKTGRKVDISLPPAAPLQKESPDAGCVIS